MFVLLVSGSISSEGTLQKFHDTLVLQGYSREDVTDFCDHSENHPSFCPLEGPEGLFIKFSVLQ